MLNKKSISDFANLFEGMAGTCDVGIIMGY